MSALSGQGHFGFYVLGSSCAQALLHLLFWLASSRKKHFYYCEGVFHFYNCEFRHIARGSTANNDFGMFVKGILNKLAATQLCRFRGNYLFLYLGQINEGCAQTLTIWRESFWKNISNIVKGFVVSNIVKGLSFLNLVEGSLGRCFSMLFRFGSYIYIYIYI